jgi:ATP-dependent exoDNAse (exonuclease V) beta subunit
MKNIQYINAGAGSGKTTRLTEILSEKLGNGDFKPSEVILTTFTELAASEFREKSRERLFNDNHADVAAELDSAAIGTVHSVALNFIKKYWYLIGVSPDMKVMSEDDLQVYISESLGNYISQDDLDFFRKYGSFFDLKDGLSHTDYDFWKDHLITIIDKVNNYNVDIENSIKNSKDIVDHIFSKETKLDIDSLTKFKDALAKDIPNHSDNEKKTTQPIHESLQKNDRSYAFLAKLYDFFTNDKQKKIKDKLKSVIGDNTYDGLIANLKAVLCTSVGTVNPHKLMTEMIERLFNIAKKWKDGFIAFKKDRHIIDYNDMERLFLKLLGMPEVEKEIKGTYKLMMVDEFQDSSPIQLEIFKSLSDLMKQSYWVGDPKQSIYGFRGADVELVKETTLLFDPQHADASSHLSYDRLDNSWRSRQPLVGLVNKCFIKAFDGVINEKDVKLTPMRQESAELSSSLYHWNCYAPHRSGEIFTNKVAARIKQLIDSDTKIQIKNTNEFRKIQPGDVAILCRKNEECKQMAKALIAKGVPVSSVNDEILQQTEVQLVFTLLKFMVDYSNKSIRADLLRLFEDMDTQEILQQRLDYVLSLSSETQDEEGNTVIVNNPDVWLEEDNQLIQKLKAFKHTVVNLSVSDMLESIVYGLALPELVAKWGDVDNRRQNLQTLCALARKYDEHCLQMGIGASVGGLLTYLSYAEVENKIDNAANAVKVLTYHKSKGLEWPYVVLSSLEDDSLETKAFTKKNFWGIHELRQKASDGKASYTIQLLPRIVSNFSSNLPQPIVEACSDWPTFQLFVTKEQNDLRNLLYVGMTRARDYLTTLSLQGSKDNLPTLAWIRNTGISTGEITNDAAHLWGEENLPPVCEDISNINTDEATAVTEFTRYQYPDNLEIVREPKYLSPSKLPQIEFAKEYIEILEDLDCRIEPYRTKEENQAAAGTCIHNVFAVYDPTLSHEENVEKATSIRNGNGMYEIIPDVDKVITSIEHLYAWLQQTYGKASSIKHEVPFIHPLPGQVVHGEIDLLWMLNDHECVLIDFKNFPGSKANIEDPNNDHYAGHYASQLKAYREVLQASGLTVRDSLIYYSVMGCVVRLNLS